MDVKKMIDAILRQRMNLSEGDLRQMVNEKKQKIGAGYLTEQGALFLVAADLGITLEESPKLEMGLKDLYAGAREVTVLARVMKLSPLKRFKRNDDSEALLRNLTVYDNDSSVRVNLWDDAANLPETLGIKPGDAVRISKAYVKSGIDGRNVLNAGARSMLEIVREEDAPQIKGLDSMTVDVSEITGSEENVVVAGAVSGSPRVSDFVNRRGQPSKMMDMRIAGTDEKTIRIVLWNIDEQTIPKVMRLGAKIRLVGLRTRSNQYGEIELHGDEGTSVELVDEQIPEEIEVMPLRIISVSRKKVGSKQNSFALALDRAKRLFTLVMNESFADKLQKGQLVECVPSRVYGSTLILEDDAYVRASEDDSTFPDVTALERKVRDVKPSPDELYFLEAVTLTPSRVQEVQLKDGSSTSFGETLLGDDTGEIRLVGWRETSGVIEKLGTGQRIKVYGVMAYVGRDGNTELRLKPFSSIAVISN
ncbi:MAG: hypothetical protein ACE5JV_03085 [Nitrososphaerales archaeon]